MNVRWATLAREEWVDGEVNPTLDNLIRMRGMAGEVQHVVAEKDSRNIALAKLLATGAKSVLLMGKDAVRLFRPDLQLKDLVGVPMVISGGVGQGKPVVAIPTYHPTVATRAKKLREELVENVGQWFWRGKMDVMGRWPEGCVKCKGGLDKYDAMGVGWCRNCWRGMNPPKHTAQERLEW